MPRLNFDQLRLRLRAWDVTILISLLATFAPLPPALFSLLLRLNCFHGRMQWLWRWSSNGSFIISHHHVPSPHSRPAKPLIYHALHQILLQPSTSYKIRQIWLLNSPGVFRPPPKRSRPANVIPGLYPQTLWSSSRNGVNHDSSSIPIS